jgi:hypothetical protein
VLGAVLGNRLRSRTGRTVKDLGFLHLRDFVQRHLPDEVKVTQAELVLKSTPEGKPHEHSYANCLLICRLCNGKRGDRHAHRRPDGTRLLNPIDDVWAEHFVLVEDRLDPRDGDADAAYTRDAYGMNDDMHTLRRRKLRELLEERLENLRRERAEIADIDERLRGRSIDATSSEWLLIARGRHVEAVRRALNALKDLSGVPFDCPASCRCAKPALEVASVSSQGWQELPDLQLADPPVPSKRRFRA